MIEKPEGSLETQRRVAFSQPSHITGRILSGEEVNALQQEAENAPDRPGIADWGAKAVKNLIASHRLLAERNKGLKADWQDMYDAHGASFKRCACGHMTETTFVCNGCGK